MHLYVNGAGREISAGIARPDVAAAFPGLGADHGFSAQITVPNGTTQVCAYGINTGRGDNAYLGCRTVTVGPVDSGRAPFGNFESLTVSGNTATVSGWTIDPDNPAPIAVHLYVNGAGKAYLADKSRPDVGAAFPASGPTHGFTEQITLTNGRSEICAYGINSGAGSNSFLGCRTVTVGTTDQGRAPLGYFESITPVPGGATITGWALDPDTTTPIEVHVYVDGQGTAYRANISRPDVAAAYQLGDTHGFTQTLTLTPGTHHVCVYGINTGPGPNALIGCRTTTTQ